MRLRGFAALPKMIELGLQRISRLLSQTPLSWRAIHVAGTNGKGSICACISSMIQVYNNSRLRQHTQQSTLRHGRFTSPHLVDRWDCISIDQTPVRSSVFREVEKEVLEKNRREAIGASEFELLTATAFGIFNREHIDIGVVEVGMGGRLDATNILGRADDTDPVEAAAFRPPPLVTVISSIGLDHKEFLGDTLKSIAREKAGIIKKDVPVIYDSSNESEVIGVIREVAEINSSPTATSSGDPTSREIPNLRAFRDEFRRQLPNNVASLPPHTLINYALAFNATWTTLLQLQRVPTKTNSLGNATSELITDMAAKSDTSSPGRQQLISLETLTGRKEDVLLDGAHNMQSAVALASAVEKIRYQGSEQRVTWVLTASSSKDPKDVLSPLLQNGDAVFAVEFGPVDGMPWVKPLASSDLLETAKSVVPNPASLDVHDCGTDAQSALQLASQKAAGGPLVIAGSLYLVGDVLRLLRNN